MSHSWYIPENLVFPYLLLEKLFPLPFSYLVLLFFLLLLLFKSFWIIHFKFSDYLYSVLLLASTFHTLLCSHLQTTFIKFLIVSTPLANAEVLFVCPVIISRSYHHCKNSYKIKQNEQKQQQQIDPPVSTNRLIEGLFCFRCFCCSFQTQFNSFSVQRRQILNSLSALFSEVLWVKIWYYVYMYIHVLEFVHYYHIKKIHYFTSCISYLMYLSFSVLKHNWWQFPFLKDKLR